MRHAKYKVAEVVTSSSGWFYAICIPVDYDGHWATVPSPLRFRIDPNELKVGDIFDFSLNEVNGS